jgi:hypothetical protein
LDDWWEATDRDVVIVDVVVENESGDNSSVKDAQRWQDARGIEDWTVLANGKEGWVEVWGNEGSDTYIQHSYTVLDREGRVHWHATGFGGTRYQDIIDAVGELE